MTDNTTAKKVAVKNPKAEDLLDSDDVNKYTNEISNLLTSYKEKEEQSNTSVEAMDSEFLAIGNKLIDIEKSILASNTNKITARTLFAATKLKVANNIKKDVSNVEKVVKVAKFCSTENYTKYQDRLPSSWGTLYLLTGLKDEQRDTLFEDKEINASITRSALSKKISAIKNPNNNGTIHKISISVGEKKASDEDLNTLKNYLKENFPSWEVK